MLAPEGGPSLEPVEPAVLNCGPLSTWAAMGACADPSVDPAIFYPEGRGVSIADAKAVCRRCPVKVCCGVDAILRGDEHGVWGGMSGRQRRRARKLWVAGMPILDAIARFDDSPKHGATS